MQVNGALSHKSPLKMLLESKQTEMSFGSLSKLMLKLAVKHRFRLPPYYILIVRSLATLEGVALKADPHFKIVKAAFPIVLRQLLYDSRCWLCFFCQQVLAITSAFSHAGSDISQILCGQEFWLLLKYFSLSSPVPVGVVCK